MATLTPDELLGVLKENNAQLLTQIPAIFSANCSPAPTGAQSSGNGVTGDQDMDDAWDDEDGEDLTWEDVLPRRGHETRRDGGGFAVADALAKRNSSAINDIVKNRPLHRRPTSSSTTQEQRRPPATQPAKEHRGGPVTHDRITGRCISRSDSTCSRHAEKRLGRHQRHQKTKLRGEPKLQA